MATFSFELYPPRTPAAELSLHTALDHLIAAGPEFISVTYGANGSSRESSLGVVRRLLAGGISPMAHLTCVGSSYAEATLLIREFLDAGVTSFLALRGDPPAGASEADSFLGDLGSAGELVQLIHRVQAEKDQFAQVPVPGFPDAKRLASGRTVTRDHGPCRRTSIHCSPSRQPGPTSPSRSCFLSRTTTSDLSTWRDPPGSPCGSCPALCPC